MGRDMANTSNSYPYRDLKFRLKMNNRYVAGFTTVSELIRTLETDTSEVLKAQDQSKYGPFTFERGITHDVVFWQWANGKDGKTIKKDIVLELYSETGQKVLAYNLYGCWISEFVAVSLSDSNDFSIESMTLQNEGWERNKSVKTG